MKEGLAFPGRREDHRLIEPALADALALAGAGLARGNTLAARAVLDEALELTRDVEVGWTVVFAEGDSTSPAQLAAIARAEEHIEIALGRGDPAAVRDFCIRERASFDATTILPEVTRRFDSGTRVTTTARVLGLWARERG